MKRIQGILCVAGHCRFNVDIGNTTAAHFEKRFRLVLVVAADEHALEVDHCPNLRCIDAAAVAEPCNALRGKELCRGQADSREGANRRSQAREEIVERLPWSAFELWVGHGNIR